LNLAYNLLRSILLFDLDANNLEFESPLSPYRAIKKAMKFFETKVRNTKIKEAPLSRRDQMLLEVGITTIWGEIFWIKISTRRSKDKQSSKVFVTSRPGTRHMFFSLIVILMSGPFIYMGLNKEPIGYFTLIVAALLAFVGIASMIMPVVRIRKTNKQIKEVLTSEDEFEEETEKEAEKPITSRLEYQ